MKKKKNAMPGIFKKIMKIVFASMIVAGIGTAFVSGKVYQEKMVCKGMEACIADSLDNKFIKAADVRNIIAGEYGTVEGRRCRETDLSQIESIIDSQDIVRKCEVYFTRDGILNIEIEQRNPILRIQMRQLGFYADREGVMFPLQQNHTANVIVLDGDLPITYENFINRKFSDRKQEEWMEGAVKLAAALEDDITWNGKISQIHCNGNEGMILVPKTGQERFIFGEPDNISRKLSKMSRYYTHIKPVKQDKKYTRVDLRYEGQIICK